MKQREGGDVETRSSIRRIVILKRSEAGNVGGRADTIRRIVVLVKQFLHRADMFAIADEWEIEAGACVRGKVHLVHLGRIRLRGDEVLGVARSSGPLRSGERWERRDREQRPALVALDAWPEPRFPWIWGQTRWLRES